MCVGLEAQVPYYDYALDMVLDIEANDIISDDQHVGRVVYAFSLDGSG